ncbi:MAG: hypothetical protein SGI97_04320 [candidate division Zixibacteria bacterium]|nr:hypothetical protein [candidate division Zixibacteria bacterium]
MTQDIHKNENRQHGFLTVEEIPRKLDIGDPFPRVGLQLVSGNHLTLPDDLRGNWAALIVYRGFF